MLAICVRNACILRRVRRIRAQVVRTLVVSGVVCAMLPTVGTGVASADGGIGLAPAHFDPNSPRTRAYFVRDVAPGQGFSDTVIVSNTGQSSADLFVNAVDALTGVTTGAVYANRQDPVRRWGAWVTPSTSEITVQPQSRTPVDFTVHVPPDAQPGDHLAGIAFENAHPQAVGKTLSVTTVTRSVIGVQLKVSGVTNIHVHLDQVTLSPLPADQQAAVVVRLGNDGLVLAKPHLQVALDGPDGYHRTMTRMLDTVLPGDTVDYPLPWPDRLAAGTYHTSVTAAVAGMTSPATLSAPVTLVSALVGPPAPTTADPAIASRQEVDHGSSWWIIPAVLLALVVGGGGGALLTWRLARRAASGGGR
jgi:Bacterial protein of unknown function (DUF916)